MNIDISPVIGVSKGILAILVSSIARSVMGWLPKAIADHRIVRFEWKQLVQTIFRVGTIGIMGYVGLSISGVDNAAIGAAIGAFFADKLFSSLKENKAVRA